MGSETLTGQLEALGLRGGDVVLIHSSFKSLGIPDPEDFIQAVLGAIGQQGTLLLPALSYAQNPAEVHSTLTTPTCVGFLTEYFRRRPGTRRSVHPTHSVCGVGSEVQSLLGDHSQDTTPCGAHSPFNKLLHHPRGKILMAGCGLRPNTSMHAVEEYARPPYLFGDPVTYTITDDRGQTYQKVYTHHGFKGAVQRYDRVEGILKEPDLHSGQIGQASCWLIRAEALLEKALQKLNGNSFYFVDQEFE